MQKPAWWEPIAHLTIAGGIIGAAITSAYWSASASTSAANAEKAVASLKADQEKVLAAEKSTMEKTLAAEKEVLKAQADSVKAQAATFTHQGYFAMAVPSVLALGALGVSLSKK